MEGHWRPPLQCPGGGGVLIGFLSGKNFNGQLIPAQLDFEHWCTVDIKKLDTTTNILNIQVGFDEYSTGVGGPSASPWHSPGR